MTPPQIVIMIGIGLVTKLITDSMPYFKSTKTTAFDSPKDELYYTIGKGLDRTVQDNTRLTPIAKGVPLVAIIEESNTFVWHNSSQEIEDINFKGTS